MLFDRKPNKREIILQRHSFKILYILIILFLCLLSAVFGIGDERIRILVQKNNSDNTNDSQLVFNYMLKPALPPPIWALRWNENSMDVYDISVTMDIRYYDFKETKEFLDNYHCENLIFRRLKFVSTV